MNSFLLGDPNSKRHRDRRTSSYIEGSARRESLRSSILTLTEATNPQVKELEAKALVSKLSLVEKVALCSGRDIWTLKPIRDLSAVIITDGPHGVRKQGEGDSTDLLTNRTPSTCFPTASCLACSWDPKLLRKMGMALGTECVDQDVTVLLGPGINIKRHPCGGRNFEYFSEDPYVTGVLASALVEGVQSQGVGTCIKHFCVNNQESQRMRVNVRVDERTLREIYWRGFEMVIRDKPPFKQPWTIMAAYNMVNGTYCSENEDIWKVVRDEWGFHGAVMTDWGATNDRVRGLKAGVDLEMPGSQGAYDSQLIDAVKSGELPMETLDATVARNMALTLMGQDIMQRITEPDMDAHHELARRVAMESAVLLKNEENLLPLARNTSIAVIGNFAKKPRYQGMGSSQVLPTKLDCAWDGLKEYTDTLVYATGYSREHDEVDSELIDEAVAAAKKADVALIFCGLLEIDESESFDREHMSMPPSHNALIEAVCAVNPRTVAILSHGAPVTMPWVDKPSAILEGYLAGQASGSAAADLLFGVGSPCGKLAETFPLRVEDVASHSNFPGEHYEVHYKEGLNVGYRHFDTAKMPVLFPFGHGLSYTKFEYRDLQSTLVGEDRVQVKFTLCNVGAVRAAEVVQCYVHDVESTVYRPAQELKAFSKVWLDAGEEQRVQLMLEKQAFSFYDMGAKEWILEPGVFEIRVGASSRDLRLKSTLTISTGKVPTDRARKAHPPVQHSAGVLVTDKEFACMLGVDNMPPLSSAVRPFHRNTLVGELQHSLFGRMLRKAVWNGADKGMEDPNDELHRKVMHALADSIPMRGMVIFSQGDLTFPELQLILALLNWRLFQICAHIFPAFRERSRRRKRQKAI